MKGIALFIYLFIFKVVIWGKTKKKKKIVGLKWLKLKHIKVNEISRFLTRSDILDYSMSTFISLSEVKYSQS